MTLTIDMPDGTSSIIDFCAHHTLDTLFELDPTDLPEIRSPTLFFDAISRVRSTVINIHSSAACEADTNASTMKAVPTSP